MQERLRRQEERQENGGGAGGEIQKQDTHKGQRTAAQKGLDTSPLYARRKMSLTPVREDATDTVLARGGGAEGRVGVGGSEEAAGGKPVTMSMKPLKDIPEQDGSTSTILKSKVDPVHAQKDKGIPAANANTRGRGEREKGERGANSEMAKKAVLNPGQGGDGKEGGQTKKTDAKLKPPNLQPLTSIGDRPVSDTTDTNGTLNNASATVNEPAAEVATRENPAKAQRKPAPPTIHTITSKSVAADPAGGGETGEGEEGGGGRGEETMNRSWSVLKNRSAAALLDSSSSSDEEQQHPSDTAADARGGGGGGGGEGGAVCSSASPQEAEALPDRKSRQTIRPSATRSQNDTASLSPPSSPRSVSD